MTRMKLAVFRLILDRDGNRCIRCGAVGDTLVPNHRANRGMGGSKSRETPANVVSMDSFCNSLIENSPTAARTARMRGWKLQSWHNPLEEPIYDPYDRLWYLLTDDYERVRTDPAPSREVT